MLLTMPLPTSRRTSTPRLHDRPEVAGIDADQQHGDDVGAEDADGENRIARIGIETMPPRKRGASTRLLGSTAIMSIAASCSPAFIRPISAVSDVPARPAKSSAGDDRPELAHQRQVDDQAERLGGAVGDERVVHLQRQHEADRQARGEDDDQREVADRVDLRDDQVGPAQRRRAGAQQLDEEERVVAEDAQHLERALRRAARSRPVIAPAPPSRAALKRTPKSSASGRAG